MFTFLDFLVLNSALLPVLCVGYRNATTLLLSALGTVNWQRRGMVTPTTGSLFFIPMSHRRPNPGKVGMSHFNHFAVGSLF